ncbi:Dehydrogenase multihelical [Penicillium bovifimosum]|uniref:Dehydrogenase multihelical n=1 Tax=Penicillium bovifimosum TaxID=126998 RepID=A0A9W9GM04_9EURO|nr:Dehydrogenase multihelical [Penicillium bovifimosum]KAJ5123964.1 Dehydrogenase multihelical [Penicillium bovifimosum]
MSEHRVAWIGLGNIGRGMSSNIAHKGPQTSPLLLYNRTTSRAKAHASTLPNTSVANTLPEAITPSTIIFTCVGDDEALLSIITSVLNDSSIDLTSKIFIDCSTVHPDTSRKISSLLSDRGADFIACPVFGAPSMADAGKLVVVPAGKRSVIEKVQGFFDGVVAMRTIDLASGSGEDIDVGKAGVLKVLGNSFILNTVGVLAEAMVGAEVSGLGTGPLKEFLDIFAPGAFVSYAERMIGGDYWKREEPLFAVDLARKDLRHVQGIAGEGG